jgi:hypothetical protein
VIFAVPPCLLLNVDFAWRYAEPPASLNKKRMQDFLSCTRAGETQREGGKNEKVWECLGIAFSREEIFKSCPRGRSSTKDHAENVPPRPTLLRCMLFVIDHGLFLSC